jgi:hypothetical protein
MRFGVTARTISSWVVILGLLLGGLAPAMTRLMNAGNGESWRAICSSVGIQWVAPTGSARLGKTAPSPSSQQMGEHCPWCSLHTLALGMPPAPPKGIPLLLLGHAVPQLFLAAPHTLHAWSSAQPRAPPRLS